MRGIVRSSVKTEGTCFESCELVVSVLVVEEGEEVEGTEVEEGGREGGDKEAAKERMAGGREVDRVRRALSSSGVN